MILSSDAPFLALLWGALYALFVARPTGRQLGHTYLKPREKWAYFYFTVMVSFLAILPGVALFGSGRTGWGILVLMAVPLVITPITLIYYRFLLGPHLKDVMEEINGNLEAKRQARKDTKGEEESEAEGKDS